MSDPREDLADVIEGLSRQLRDISDHPRPVAPAERQAWQLRISDLVALISLGGMIYAFVSNQSAAQTTVVMRLDSNERMLNQVQKNSDQIPMLQYQMTDMRTKQETADRERQEDRKKTQEMQEALLKMGLNLKAKP